MKLTDSSRKKMEGYVKCLVQKCVQVIVQSRRGEAQKTACKVTATPNDWFSLNVPDLSEITNEIRRVLGDVPNKMITPTMPACVELSLRAADGESMVLEIWEIALLPDCDSSAKSMYDVYNRMGMLLKSLITVTRVVPAYRLALTQNSDSFILHYRLYSGPMQEETCGENSKLMNVGQVGLPYGTISLSVRYRSKLVLGSKEKQSSELLMLKSNYFAPNPTRRDSDAPNGDLSSASSAQTANKVVKMTTNGTAIPSARPLKNAAERPTTLPTLGEQRSPSTASGTAGRTKKKTLNECSPYGAFASEPRELKSIGASLVADGSAGGGGAGGSSAGREGPEDLCDMFCTLLLEPDETLPVEEEEKIVTLSDDEDRAAVEALTETGDPWQDSSSSLSNRNAKEHFVYVDLKPAFSEYSSDLGIFFSGAPPPLKSLYDDTPADSRSEHRAGREPETLEQQVNRIRDISEFEQFFQEICGLEA